MHYSFLRVHSFERWNKLIPVWDFKLVRKQVLFTWSYILAAFQMSRRFISGNVYMIFYHLQWNFIFVKMINMKSIPALSFNRTCTLNTTSNESALIHFVSGKLFWHENLMMVWNFISVKMTNMKSIPFWVSFCLNSCEQK